MSRTILAIAAGLLCGVAGLRHSVLLRREAEDLRRWQAVLRVLALLLRESALSLPQALVQAAPGQQRPDKLLRTLAAQMQAQPLNPLPSLYARIQERPAPASADAALARMTERLSRGSLEARVLAVTQAADEIALLAETTGPRTARDARMWSQLGWTLGACLTLLLL